MKRSLLKLLPLMAAVTLATSCSKDDDNNAPEKKQNASPQEKTIIYNPDGTVTIPYSIKYSTGKSLNKKMTYSDDGMKSKYVPTEGDEIKVSGEGVSGKLTLQYELSDFGGREEVFKGNLTATSEDAADNLTNNKITLTYEYGTALEEPASSNKSLQDLMESCNHLYTATGKYSDESITLSDQNTYLAISMSPCCNHDITINDKDFTVEDGRIWIAVPGGKPVKSTGLGTELDKAAKDVVPGTIHTVARQYFTVSNNKVVKQFYFSKGNLQYNPAAGQWRFAEHQYDCCVTVNGGITGGDITAWYNTDTKYNGWIDLFGWGMWLDGDGNDPLRIAKDGEYYPTIETKNFKYMSLSDNPVIGSEWTTLTAGQNGSKKEWDLLLAHLKDVNGFGGGQITTEEGVMVHGIILLPDDWSLPNGITFNSCKQNAVSFIDNKYTVKEWKKMEANGAVFMPAAGMAEPSSNGEVSLGGFNNNCYYWTSTAANDDNANAYIISAHEKFFYQSNVYRYYGLSVRLVRPL
ncbi:MAG: hypothetical protein PUC50_04010 [Bacteroidales bacterium]|nr:hypothetical protein [Bacteroidales bacterium]